ncbi:NAD(P)-binding domain-containing protein [Amycolatopsis regifaucium]|uniref:Pyrroline-5-carboxylate reductase n=1 Tax=Amycolatopsis regifaucium TaxID=546365 RepID=A0A154MS20_9PSEU|nr:NAD(P)-binding domain-containing protein [Amycolatopsis regifaucium]KZB86577.1 pyrroline-5-carboxylate reductase [Amycolatopsis regifaucium]OKA03522.1 pyrroline-5-carboxylate reductase [Amycolatopsis regifaucium]SFJ16553.1 pyrroline-5-carboxylate reductase [Amycolatopsis regifaucium]
MTYGFVGAGEITAAIVEGLSKDITDPPTIYLSPRGRSVGQELSARFANVHVCDSNQAVVDNATTVILGVRPSIGREVLTELTFRPEHILISALAGVPLSQLREWAAPATEVVRSIPLPPASRRQSLTAMYPDNAEARALFDSVGGSVVPGKEEDLDIFSAATATFAAHLDYLGTIAAWMTDQGVDDTVATTFTSHIFGQLGQALLHHDGSLETLTGKHMTPGGLNEQLLTDLRTDRVPDTVRRALDGILTRLRDE